MQLSTTTEVPVNVQYIPESNVDFTTTRTHFVASYAIDVHAQGVTATGRNEPDAVGNLIDLWREANPNVEPHTVNTIVNERRGYPAQLLESYQRADAERKKRDADILAKKSRRAQLEKLCAEKIKFTSGWSLNYSDKVEIDAVEHWNRYTGRRETYFRQKSYNVNSAGEFNWDVINKNLVKIHAWKSRRETAAKMVEEKRQQATALKDQIVKDILDGNEMDAELARLTISDEGNLRLTIDLADPEVALKIIQAIREHGGVQLTK